MRRFNPAHVFATYGALPLLLLAGLSSPLAQPGTLSAQPRSPSARPPSVQVSLDASAARVAMGEVFQLQARVQVKAGQLEAFQVNIPLDDFEVIGRSVSRPMSFSFGFSSRGGAARTSTVEQVEVYQLRALKEGTFTLGPAEAFVSGKAHRSQAVDVEVKGGTAPQVTPPTASTGDTMASDAVDVARPTPEVDVFTFDERAFLRMTLSKAEPYVGEQVELSVYLYVGQPLQGSPSFEREPKVGNFWVEDLSQTSGRLREGSEVIQGRRFRVYELRRMALFPLKPGKASVIGPRLKLDGRSLFDRLQGHARAQKLSVKDASLMARPLPPGAKEPALVGETSLEAALSTQRIAVGETATWTFTVVTQGNAPLLRFEPELAPGMHALSPTVSTERNVTSDGLQLTHTLSYTLVAEAPGAFTLPAFALSVVDPRTGNVKHVRTSEEHIDVTGVADAFPSREEEKPSDNTHRADAETAAETTDLSWRTYLDLAAEDTVKRSEAAADAAVQNPTPAAALQGWLRRVSERSTLSLLPWLLGPVLLVGMLWAWLSFAVFLRRQPRRRAWLALERFRAPASPDIRAWQELFSSLLQVWPNADLTRDAGTDSGLNVGMRARTHSDRESRAAPVSRPRTGAASTPGEPRSQPGAPRLVDREPASLSALDLAGARIQLPEQVYDALAALYDGLARGTYGAAVADAPSGAPSSPVSAERAASVAAIAAALAAKRRFAPKRFPLKYSKDIALMVVTLTAALLSSLVTAGALAAPPVGTAGTGDVTPKAHGGEVAQSPGKHTLDADSASRRRPDASLGSVYSAAVVRDVGVHVERARAAAAEEALVETRRHLEVAWRLAPHQAALSRARRELSAALGTSAGEPGTIAGLMSRELATLALIGVVSGWTLILGMLLGRRLWRLRRDSLRAAVGASVPAALSAPERHVLVGISAAAMALIGLATLVRWDQDRLTTELPGLAIVTAECPLYVEAVGGNASGSLPAGEIVRASAPTGRRIPLDTPNASARWLAATCIMPLL